MVSPYSPTKSRGPRQAYVPATIWPPKTSDPTSDDTMNPATGGAYTVSTVWINSSTNIPWMNTGYGVWSKLSTNSDVAGPASATDNAIALFNGTTGKVIKNSAAIVTGTVLTGLTQIGIGIAPTAYLGLKAGTATAGTAPLKFALGVNLTTPEAGAVEYDGTHLTYTNNSAARKTLAVGPASTTDLRLPKFSGTAGELVQSGILVGATDVMTFPAGGGNVLTTGGAAARKGTFTLTGGASGDIATTAALTGSVIAITITALGTVSAAQAMLVTIDTGVKFAITSADGTDTSSGTWAIVA